MDIKRNILPVVVALRLNAKEYVAIQSKVNVAYQNFIQNAVNIPLSFWGEIANDIGIHNDDRADVVQLKHLIFAILQVSKNYLEREKLAQRLGVETISEGHMLCFGTKPATVVGLHQDGRVIIRFLDEQRNGMKQQIAANPSSCSCLIELGGPTNE